MQDVNALRGDETYHLPECYFYEESMSKMYDQACKELKLLKDRHRWRKVDEELPDKSCEVLVKDSDACMYIAYFSYGKFILDRYTQINGDIIEWKPIN